MSKSKTVKKLIAASLMEGMLAGSTVTANAFFHQTMDYLHIWWGL